jgi:hypothetical protein
LLTTPSSTSGLVEDAKYNSSGTSFDDTYNSLEVFYSISKGFSIGAYLRVSNLKISNGPLLYDVTFQSINLFDLPTEQFHIINRTQLHESKYIFGLSLNYELNFFRKADYQLNSR